MMTTAQQKVKQELEELKLNALVHQNSEPVLPRKKRSSKKWILTTTLILVTILTCSLLLMR
ncbi:hypothetical protein [Neobacillus drentensis]|uniref:hypothetical protein n=1 Tax=Neobacillus drentensis TaxID=220684 RepID=UPI00285D08F0|nr:hypothetical protein [Neobacillus drentensis]MDR7240835.1 hypothetical protein [Neobacillus drentensis]